jgi:hypothetical protein
MAMADDTASTIHWILLCDALREAIMVLGSQALAKRGVKALLATGQLPWTCMLWEGREEPRRKDEPQLGSLLAAMICFWDAPSHWIDWEDNSAGENVTCGAQALGINVSRDHFLAALPPGESREGEEVRGAGAWIATEAKKMKASNEVPPDIGITDFARELASRMRKAAASDRSLRAIGWRSIKNRLPAWGLWPVTSIK